jgi:hypothetical protein
MSSDPPSREGAVPAPRRISFPGRVIGVFVSPGATFDDIRERPNWILPLLVLMGVYLAVALVIPESLYRETVEAQMAAQGREIPPQQMQTALTMARIFGYLGAVVFPPLGALATAGLLFLVFVLLAGADARFSAVFSATLYANLIAALGAIVTTPVAIAQEDLQARLSFALLVPGLEEGLLYALLNGITIFGLWTAIVLGIGAARISRTVSTGAAVGIVLGLYALWVVVFAAFSTLTGAA